MRNVLTIFGWDQRPGLLSNNNKEKETAHSEVREHFKHSNLSRIGYVLKDESQTADDKWIVYGNYE